MAIEGLRIIGESINDSVPSTKKLFDADDINGLRELAKVQDEAGAAYIDINVGTRTPDFMAQVVKEVQSVTARPLCIDTPDPAIAKAGLEAYDPDRAGGVKPILNSITLARLEMLDLYPVQPFCPILMITEGERDGGSVPNKSGEEIYQSAKEIMAAVRASGHGITNDDCIYDPGIAPLGSDTENLTRATINALTLIQKDPDLAGVHASIGLSNFTVMLPAKRPDGSLVKGPLQSALLTKAVPLGMDMVIGSAKRDYNTLPPDHPAMACVEDVLKLDGYDCIMRVMEFYST